MTCLDFVAEDFRCLKGIPVTTRFSRVFCNGKHEKCPLVIWEKTRPAGAEHLKA
ncbi:MAG: hypothetical protein M1497_09725 [Nitrospirae bacterium]|nr:hypothetical protein [Nitrospirota bacterium]